jgi:septal ring factor EnvC (AmiA/AmiB activator)
MILAIAMIAIALGCLSVGYAIGGTVERFIFHPIQENAMSTQTDALKVSLDTGTTNANTLATTIADLQAKAAAVSAQLADGAAITIERDSLKAQIADLNATIATLQAEADATNTQNKANADALANVATSLTPAARVPAAAAQ